MSQFKKKEKNKGPESFFNSSGVNDNPKVFIVILFWYLLSSQITLG